MGRPTLSLFTFQPHPTLVHTGRVTGDVSPLHQTGRTLGTQVLLYRLPQLDPEQSFFKSMRHVDLRNPPFHPNPTKRRLPTNFKEVTPYLFPVLGGVVCRPQSPTLVTSHPKGLTPTPLLHRDSLLHRVS